MLMSGLRRSACNCCNKCGIDSTGSIATWCCPDTSCSGFSPSSILVSFDIPSVTWYQLCGGVSTVYATIPSHTSTATMVKQSSSTPCGYQAGNAQLTSFPNNFYTYDCDGTQDELWKGSGTGGAIFSINIRPAANDGYAADIDTPCQSFNYCSGIVITYLMRYYNSTLNKYLPQLFNFSWNNGEITDCTYSVPFYSYVSGTPTEKKNNYTACTIGTNQYCGGSTEYAKDATGWSTGTGYNLIWDCSSAYRACSIPNARIISIS